MLILDWKFLFVAGLLGITVAAVWLLINGSRERGRAIVWSQFRVYLGIALLISAITIIFVSLQLEPKVQGDINRTPKALPTTFRPGDPEFESDLGKQTIGDPIRFFDAVIDARLELGPGPNPSYSVWDWTTTFNVQNIGDSEVNWHFSPLVASDLAGNPYVYISKPVVTEAGHDGDRVATYESKYIEERTGIQAKARYKTIIKLKPGITYRVSIARQIFDVLERGQTPHFFSKTTKRITFNLKADPKLFAVEVEANYRDDKVPLKGSPSGTGDANQNSYESNEMFLPNQGLQVYWTYRGAKPVKPATASN